MTNRNPFELGAETETDPHSGLEGPGSPPPAPSLTPPRRRFSRYQLIRPLGTGGMGVVFQGRDLELHRDVAIKLVRAVGKDPAEAQARLRREAQTMAALSHPNLVAVHDIGDLGDRVFIAMELLRGGTLRDLVGAHHDWREQLRILIAGGRGLAAAHAAGVIHRDFKPDNVLLGEGDRVVVADFGLARSFDPLPDDDAPLSLETASMLGGTLAYMPPERIAGETGDPRVDQFAWCVTAFEVLEGYRPFDLARPGSATPRLELHAERHPWSRRELPLHVRAAIDRGLALDRNARWPSMDALLSALEAPRVRRRYNRLAAAALLAVAMALGVWGAWRLASRAPLAPGYPGTPPPATSPWAPTLLARESGNNPAHFSAIDDSATTLAFASRSAIWTQQRASGIRKELTAPKDLVIEALRFGRGSSLLLTGRSGASWVTYLVDTERDTARRVLTLPAAHVVDVSPDGKYLLASAEVPGPLAADAQVSPIGARVVALAEQADAAPVQLTDSHVSQCVWSPSGSSIACISASREESQLLSLDVSTGGAQTVARIPGPHALRLLRWPEPNQLFVVEQQALALNALALNALVSVVQRWTLTGGALRDRQALYVTPVYNLITGLELAKGELFYTTANERWRSGIIPLGGEPTARQLQPLDTGSLSDGSLIGWMPSGEVVLYANIDGRFRVIRMAPKGRPVVDDEEPATRGWPTAIVNGAIWRKIRRREPVICAANAFEPCIVLTRSDDRHDLFQRWEPERGATGSELLAIPRSENGRTPGLSRAGELAVANSDHLAVYDMKGRRLRELRSEHSYLATAWSSRNQLYAVRSLGAICELVKIGGDGIPIPIFRHSTFSLQQLLISPEGGRALVNYVDSAMEHWAVNLTPPELVSR